MLDYEVRAMLAWQRTKAAVKKGVRDFFTDENGDTNMISIVVVLVVVLGLAILFRDKATSFVNDLWTDITGAGDSLKNNAGGTGGGMGPK